MMSKISCTSSGDKTHGGLVQHQHGSVAHQRTAHGQHLLLAAGHGARQLLAALLQAGEQGRTPFPCWRQWWKSGWVYAPMSRFSSTVMCRNTWRPSGTCARPLSTILWARTPLMLLPLYSTSPVRGFKRPEMVFRVVDLPAPLAPIRVTISPALTVEGDILYGVDVAVVDVDAVHLQ